jgi:serine/threonine-protein kinase RsbW
VGTVSVPHAATSAGEIRRLLTSDLRARHVRAAVVEEAVLLASELIGNAVRHARALPDDSILVSWRVEDGRLHIRVTDGGSQADGPHLTHAGPQDTRGRGLSIVDALAALWGVETGAGSTTVWAILPVQNTPRHRRSVPSATVDAGSGGASHPMMTGA